MPRPRKLCRVAFLPGITYFKPAGIPLRELEEVHLSVEEAEAIRLKDLESLEQEQGALRMSISRPTFQRILASGRYKIADALLNGKAIKIEGGKFEIASRRFKCRNGHEWDVSINKISQKPPEICPACDTTGIESILYSGQGKGRRGKGWHEGI